MLKEIYLEVNRGGVTIGSNGRLIIKETFG